MPTSKAKPYEHYGNRIYIEPDGFADETSSEDLGPIYRDAASLARATIKETIRGAVLGAVQHMVRTGIYNLAKAAKYHVMNRRDKYTRTSTVRLEPSVVQWLSFYMSKGSQETGAEHLRAQMVYSNQESGRKLGNTGHRLIISPSPGKAGFEFDYKDNKFVLNHHADTRGDYYTLTVQNGSLDIFYDLLVEAFESFADKEDSSAVHVWRAWGGWNRLDNRDQRPAGSVVVDKELDKAFRSDLEGFLESRDWYAKVGQPYRRGYLFEGPPGTGKTSYVQMIANEYDLDVHYLSLSGSELTSETLIEAFDGVGAGSILLIEDIDTLFMKNSKVKVEGRTSAPVKRTTGEVVDGDTVKDDNRDMAASISLDDFLNVLDGVVSGQARILVMTANHPEVLPGVLIRDGRIDMKLHFGYSDAEQGRNLFLYFFPGEERLADMFGEAVQGRTPASYRQHLIKNRDNAAGALNEALMFGTGNGSAKNNNTKLINPKS